MTRAAILIGCALAGLVSAASAAQDQGDRARLDDFALPSPSLPQRLEQVTKGDAGSAPVQARDRALLRPSRSEAAGTMPVQISQPVGGQIPQLSTVTQSRAALAAPASNPNLRLPEAVQRIGGRDRCDPQLAERVYAECLRILELRSDEFNAPQPATLSPEQRLLSEQRDSRDTLMTSPTALRLRFATTGQPDANLESNQELAAIFLSVPDAPAPEQTPEDAQKSSLGQLLEGLGIPVVVPPGGN